MSLSKFSRVSGAVVLAAASVGLAQDATPTTLSSASQQQQQQQQQTPQMPDYLFTLGGDASYSFDTDFKDDNGSFSVFRSGSSVRMDHLFDPQTAFSLTFNGEWSHYFFRNIAAVPGDDGSDSLDVYQFDIRPVVSHQFNDHFSAFGGLTVTAAGMAEAKLGDSLTYGVFGGVNYRIAPKVWIGGGVSVVTQLEDNPLVVPLVTLSWDVTPQLQVASDGLGVKATYKIDDAWSVYARARYDYRQFRLDGGEIISDGVITDQSVPVTVGVNYAVDQSLTVSADVGAVVWRRIEFDTSGGDQAGADEANPALFASIQVRFAF